METMEVDSLARQLATGFDTLQGEYQKLFSQYAALERKLASAREQYNELARLCDSGSVATPPLSLTSSPHQRHAEVTTGQTVSSILEQSSDPISQSAAHSISLAVLAADRLRLEFQRSSGVKIWTGPSADRPERTSSRMPSISESPLEQDFTVEGKPSRLGCPFASMAGKKLSSHAASVLSRYNASSSAPGSTVNGQDGRSIRSSVSRVNGKESLAKRAASDRRASFADPIKAEICGFDSHEPTNGQVKDQESPLSERAAFKAHVSQQQEAGVCPIRFLDQHSPEEVATYFERHKHELPRSHEVCVKRYQSNDKQIQELDAKYGNLVSMIQGLGEKHQTYLPKEPDAEEPDVKDGFVEDDGKCDEKVRKWASSVSAQAGHDDIEQGEDEERSPHFERPLRDIRVGESPSRPWGISVPARYLEEVTGRSDGSSSPVKLRSTGIDPKQEPVTRNMPARCPFGYEKVPKQSSKAELTQSSQTKAQPIFINPEPGVDERALHRETSLHEPEGSKNMVFTGPVFIGYSADDAAKILRDSGLGGKL